MITLSMRRLLFTVPIIGIALLAATTTPVVAENEKTDVSRLTASYGAAWASRNVGDIMALHTVGTEFLLFVDGATPACGREAVRAAFDEILTANPGYTSETRAIYAGSDFAVIEYDIVAPPVHDMRMGGVTFTAPTRDAPFRLPAIDVITFEGSLVASKRTYLDTETYRRQVALTVSDDVDSATLDLTRSCEGR